MVNSDYLDAAITHRPEKQHVVITKPIAVLGMMKCYFADLQALPRPAGRWGELVAYVEKELLDPVGLLTIEGFGIEGVDTCEIACGLRSPNNRHG